MSYAELVKSVIQNKLCCYCGACVAVCQDNCLVFSGNGPKLEKACTECGRCIAACPGYGAPLSELENVVFNRQITNEEKASGLGAVIEDRNLVSADPEIVRKGYTGGKVTALLTHMLETGKIDGAVVTACGDATPYPHFSWPRIATSKEELLSCAGSKYMFSPNLAMLKDVANDDNLRSVVFVGLGCHIMGLRKLQLLGDAFKPLVEKISYSFGLFCGRTMMTAEDFLRLVSKLCDTTIEEIQTVHYHRIQDNNQFLVEYEVRLKNGEKKSRKLMVDDLFHLLTLQEIWHRCRMCLDYAADFADISFGGIHIISRTHKGEQLIQEAVADGILAPHSEYFGQNFEDNARKTDDFMIRLKKRHNVKRLKKYQKQQIPVPRFES